MTWYDNLLIIVANAFTQYLVNKHLIHGLYEEHIVKRFKRKTK